ncbi:MAG: CoA transferase [archaeon]|nr:CoA transferase [archaeon]
MLPLEGIRVIDLSRMLPGPYCSMILGDLGAEVIRVEDPKYTYAAPPPYLKKRHYSESAFNSILMRNKKSIQLNLKKEGALDVFYTLIKKADVVLESFRPKVTKKLKIDYDTLSSKNPSIVYCSLTGYGQNGPYSQISGHDLNYLGLSGYLALNMERKEKKDSKPIVPCVQPADISGALYSVIGILAALAERDKNPDKKGQYIDISMLDCIFSFNPMVAAHHFSETENSMNPLHGEFPFYSTYKTKDNKFLSVGAIETKFWMNLCEGLNIPEFKLMQFSKGSEREIVFDRIQEVFSTRTQEEWMNHFKNFDTCIMPIKKFDEACYDQQLLARNMIVELDHPKLGKIKNIASPIKFSRTPLKIRNLAPKSGKDTKNILKELDLTEEKIQNLRKKGLFS